MKNEKVRVAILMGSATDSESMKGCAAVLREFKVGFVSRVLSAHRTPHETRVFVEKARSRGIEVIIAAAGGAAHLAGVSAAHTNLPVIGVPMETRELKGIDSLLSTVQMPAGVPVACVALGGGGAKNAAFLALRILALKDRGIARALEQYQASMRKSILKTQQDL